MRKPSTATKRRYSFRTKTLRLHPAENRVVEEAREALNGMERAQLMQEAVLGEAARLGLRWSQHPPPSLRGPWRYLPDRGGEPAEVRLSITVSVSLAEVITCAAEHVQTSEPLFIIGATLAHIGRLKASFKAIHASSPEEAHAIRSRLARIELPRQYEYPAPSGRR